MVNNKVHVDCSVRSLKTKNEKESSVVSKVLTMIFCRNREGHAISKKLYLIAVMSTAAAIISLFFGIYALFFHPIKRTYLAVNSKMQIIQIIPLNNAYYSNSTVGQFAVKGLVKAFNFSYINRKYHFRDLINEGFSEAGLSSLVSSLQDSGIMEKVTNDHLFVRFAVTTAPFIVQKGVVISPFSRRPTYQWVVQFRAVITYTNGTEEATKTNDYNVTVTRVPSIESGAALRIKNIVAKNSSGDQSGEQDD